MPCCLPGSCAFEQVLLNWIDGDFEGVMAQFDEHIVWIVNIDGTKVPFAASAVGTEDLRWRLLHMMDVFWIEGFDIESLQHGETHCHALVHVYYVHRATGEPLDVRVRFAAWPENGRLVRFTETADAAYVEAYTRFVAYLQQQNGPGDAP